MGRCAYGGPAHFIFQKDAAQGLAKRLRRRQLEHPNVRNAYAPVAGWTQSGVDPKRAEAGLNRLLLPCPAPLAPGRPRQQPLTPAVQSGKDRLVLAFMGALALDQANVAARDAQACVRTERSKRGIALSLVCRAGVASAAPALPDRPVRLAYGAAAPPSDAASHPGGRRGDAPFTCVTKGYSRCDHPDPRQCRGPQFAGFPAARSAGRSARRARRRRALPAGPETD
jgi:hypothetical protein